MSKHKFGPLGLHPPRPQRVAARLKGEVKNIGIKKVKKPRQK